jgi:hypothetical protein
MAASTPVDGIRLPLVAAGSGNAPDYSGLDVHGKAVLMDGLAAPARVLAAQRAGASACVFANTDDIPHEMIVSGVWGSPEPQDVEHLPRIPVVSTGGRESAVLREVMRAGAPVEVTLRTVVDTRWTEIPTLIAQVDAPGDPAPFVLFSGHVDSWHYGAMDNGTANATQLEVLRALLPHRQRFRRSLRLAFWSGHSHGRYAGSAWYADQFWEDLHDHCVAHINIDSVGGQRATVLSEANIMAEAQPVAAEVIGALTGVEFNGTRYGRAGDQSFQCHGIPSLFMSLSEQTPSQGDTSAGFASVIGGPGAKGGGLGWWWHTPEDTIDKIDPDLLVRDARIYAVVTHRFVTQPVPPLDVRASAADLLTHITAWHEKARGRFDLSAVVERARLVAETARTFQEALERASATLSENQLKAANAALVAAERPLVRANYTQSGLFRSDPALGEPPVPLLAPIEDLIKTPAGSDSEYLLLTQLVRRRNALMHELAEAHAALQQGVNLLASP